MGTLTQIEWKENHF